MKQRTRFAIVGCGYVAHFYMNNARGHDDVEVRGAYDANGEASARFGAYFGLPVYRTFDELLADGSVQIVLNLTNPRSHFGVTRACLQAGKHVYSEKPLGMNIEEAEQLLQLARERGLRLSCAPCSLLSDTAQTMWKAISDGSIGRIRLVYANYDDGMIAPNQSPWTWAVESGAHWPAKDEFEVDCTFEHPGYFLTWLGAFFGPARRVVSFSSCLLPEKGISVESMAPDFTVGCIEYDRQVVARVTCGLVAPVDKSMTIVGDEGVLYVRYLRDEREPVYWRPERRSKGELRVEAYWNRLQQRLRPVTNRLPWPIPERRLYRKYPPARATAFRQADSAKSVDFFRGPRELAEALREGREHRLSAEFGVHIVEVISALQYPPRNGGSQEMRTSFPAIRALPWDSARCDR